MLDDLLIVPLGAWLALRMIPPTLLEEYRAQAQQLADRQVSRTAAAVIVAAWLVALAGAVWLVSSAGR